MVASLDISQENKFVWALASTADAKRVFIGRIGDKDGIQVWDTVANKYEEKRLAVEDDQYHYIRLKLSPDDTVLGGYLEQRNDKRYLRFWDVKTGAALRTIEVPFLGRGSHPFTFADDGKTVAAACWIGEGDNGYSGVIEWDVETGKEKRRHDIRVVGTDRGRPAAVVVVYTPDGKQMVVAGGVTLPQKSLREFEPNAIVNTFPWSGSVWVIDRESGKLVNTLVDCRHDLVRSLRLSSDGKKLFVQPTLPSRWDRTFSEDNEFVEIQRWDVTTWKLDWVKIVPITERWKVLLQPTQ